MNKLLKIPLPILFLGLALATDLLVPYFIVMGWIPAQMRWISHAVIASVIVWTVWRILVYNRMPPVFLFIIGFSCIGFITAQIQGQGIAVTTWGWWLMFQFPFVGLFAFLQPEWPEDFPRYLVWGGVAILGGEVIVQLFQYKRGTVPGDHLAGTFGNNGTGNLVMFIFLVLAFSLGEWLANRKFLPLFITLCLGVVSSALGEMKMFLPVMLVMVGIAVLIFIFQARDLHKLITYALGFGLVVTAFLSLYNLVVPGARQNPLQKGLTDIQLLTRYMDTSRQSYYGQSIYTDMGRNFALRYGWQQINENAHTLLFGFGLGSRSESYTLGIAGQGLLQGNLGFSTGTSLLVFMQEIGVVGLACLVGFILAVILYLIRHLRQEPGSKLNGIRYGLILFTFLWPLWLWYNTAWILRVPMFLYWLTLGYVMGRSFPMHQRSPVAPQEVYSG